MHRLLLSIFLFPISISAQGYTSYFTGNPTNISTTTEYGVCMMGGATEHDNAMRWLLQKAGGGDVVVLRSSGSDGYNDYLYSELGVAVNSVETLVITSVAGATNPYVLNKVANAEMIWFAGGDQYNYVSYFRNNALEDLLNQHINVKQAPIGGTSAGMAILGNYYFSAQHGSVTTAEALANPYNDYMTIGYGDFLSVPFLANAITDTHYDNPDRRGRHSAFLARMKTLSPNVYGIACNEYVAVCIGTDGKAHVYGDYPNYPEFAYFLQDNCENPSNPETLQPNTPLTWNFAGQAIKAYKVPGTMDGAHYFDVNIWENGIGSGGSWENWSVVNGVFTAVAGTASNCVLANDSFDEQNVAVYPNPFTDFITIDNAPNASVSIYNWLGQNVYGKPLQAGRIDTSGFSAGLYLLEIEKDGQKIIRKIIRN